MFGSKPPKQPRRLPIYADAINGYHDHGIHAISVAPPLEAVRMGNTVALRLVDGKAGGEFLVRTKTVISGRSGTTPGSGTVYRVNYDSATDTLSDGDEVEVKNISAAAFDAGKYGMAQPIGNTVWVRPLEC